MFNKKEKREVIVTFRITNAEHTWLIKEAKTANCSVSEIIRKGLRKDRGDK